MRLTWTSFLALSLALTYLSVPSAPDQTNKNREIEQEIKLIENQFFDALRQSKMEMLEPIIAEDFFFVDALGKVLNKVDYLARLKGSGSTYANISIDDLNIRDYHDPIIVLGRVRWGNNTEPEYRYTHVYKRQQKGWRIITQSLTPIIPVWK